VINPLKAKLNLIFRLLALLGAHYIFNVGGLRVNTVFTLILNIRTVLFASEVSVRFPLQENTSNWTNNVISIKSPNDRLQLILA
jgi:hypothetical protein